MRQKLKKYWLLITLIIFAFITFLINQFPLFIEQYYSTGVYPYISSASRFLLGWIPFSVGDILYALAIVWIIAGLINIIKRLWRKQQNRQLLFYYGRRVLQTVLIIYISFNWLWGFNYNRLGSAYQMNLKFERYNNDQLIRLTDSITVKLKEIIKEQASVKIFDRPKDLATLSSKAYQTAETTFSFLHHPNLSVKPQLLYNGGNYIGFLGYFNPFTSEAQLNITIPKILLPMVCCHEMAHQLGYASESEANFIGYIACKQSSEPAFRYSVYYDLFSYVINDLYYRDSAKAKEKLAALPQRIKDDRKQVHAFFRSYKNSFNPLIEWIFDKYLKLNSQPKGRDSYNEVVGWLIAYAYRYGWDKI